MTGLNRTDGADGRYEHRLRDAKEQMLQPMARLHEGRAQVDEVEKSELRSEKGFFLFAPKPRPGLLSFRSLKPSSSRAGEDSQSEQALPPELSSSKNSRV